MRASGIYQRVTEQGEVKRARATFESTGVKNSYGKVIWRKLNKEGKPTNVFAEQFVPDVPWAVGKWFIKINSAVVIEKHPELKIETEISKTMTDEEYLKYLDGKYFV